MTYQWPENQYNMLPPSIREVRVLLEDWFQAMENKDVSSRIPDPFYTIQIPESTCIQICDTLDSEFEREVHGWAGTATAGGYTHAPGFRELLIEQKIALCQQLLTIKNKYRQEMPDREHTAYD